MRMRPALRPPMHRAPNVPYGLLLFLSLGVAAYAAFVYALLPLGAQLHPQMRAVFQAPSTESIW